MKIYRLNKQQRVPISLKTAWEFLTDPANLQKLTPPDMAMTIVSGNDKALHEGQLLTYKVKPLPGFNTTWVSKITQVDPLVSFTDEQVKGPYALWNHQHFITEIDGGTLMQDVIDYAVPLGFLGQLAHPLVVKPKLEKIFAYRKEQLTSLFGEYQPEAITKHDILN
ncbi:SRPBCC family protein [Gangjinia marincola]|uniref:SRPBCC family protein n=1 Tax=Gangjinia marincola TaxID=578463 RepID=A0ABN1MD59_9FLAO